MPRARHAEGTGGADWIGEPGHPSAPALAFTPVTLGKPVSISFPIRPVGMVTPILSVHKQLTNDARKPLEKVRKSIVDTHTLTSCEADRLHKDLIWGLEVLRQGRGVEWGW